MANLVEVTDANFASEVLESDVPVLVDFWATWCGPCRMLTPVLDELAGEIGDEAKIVKLNIDEAAGIAEQYGIQAVPTLLVFSNGEVQDRVTGVQSKERLHSLLESAGA